MANAHSTAKNTPPQQRARKDSGEHAYRALRKYTVGYTPNRGQPNKQPQLTIKGQWLNQIGLSIGTPVTISVEHGRLVVEVIE